MHKSFDVHAMSGSVASSPEAHDALLSATDYHWCLPHVLTHEDRITTFAHDALLFMSFSPLMLSLYQLGHYTYDQYESLEALISALRAMLRKDLKLSGRTSDDPRIETASQTLAVFAASYEGSQPEVACELRRMSEAVYDRPCEAPENMKRAFAGASQACAELAEAHGKSKH